MTTVSKERVKASCRYVDYIDDAVIVVSEALFGVWGEESAFSNTSGLDRLHMDIVEPSLYARNDRSSTRVHRIR